MQENTLTRGKIILDTANKEGALMCKQTHQRLFRIYGEVCQKYLLLGLTRLKLVRPKTIISSLFVNLHMNYFNPEV